MSNSDSGDSDLGDYEMDIDGGRMDAAKNAAGTADIGTDEEDMLLEDGDGKHYLEDSADDDDDSDDTDDTDEDDDAEAKLIAKYLVILEQISKDSTNYDNYVQLVDIAHQITDLEKIRESCELFSSMYPLAPEIWLRWLKIELNIATGDTELKRVHHLFRRAFADYFSATLALEYTNLAAKLPKSDDTWEEIISTYALHCMHGRPMFEAWRAHIVKTQPESPEKHAKLIETYERELSLPLNGMEDTYIELKLLYEKDKVNYANVDWTRIDEKYQKAKKHLAKMLPFEEQLAALEASSHQDRAQIYNKYIDECKDILTEPMVQILYERMITDCCLNASCWLAYIKYIQKREDYAKPSAATPIEVEKSPVFNQTDWDIVNRALRNCTWSAELYVEKMFIGERMELPKQEVQNITEDAFAATVTSRDAFHMVWIEYISYLRRNTNFSNEKENELLRANLTLGWESLEKQFADPYCELLKLWGRLEYGQLHDTAKGKELWTTVLESVHNRNNSALWVEFAHLELVKGCDAARKVYRKAIGIAGIDDIHTMISAWTRLERCYGTLDQLKSCQEHCQSALKSHSGGFKTSKLQKKKSSTTPTANKHSPKSKNPAKGKADDGKSIRNSVSSGKVDVANAKGKSSNISRKHKLTSDADGPSSSEMKRAKIELNTNEQHSALSSEKDAVTVFISNLPYDITANEIIAAYPELNIKHVDLKTTPNGRGRGFGYIEVTDSDQVELALSFDRRPINGRPAFLSSITRDKEKRQKFKYAADIEPSKLFVKGLPHDVTKEEVEAIFTEFGPLKDVRLVTHKSGTFKGIAYVEFEQESSASKAVLKMDQFVFKNSTLTVAISRPPPVKPKGMPSNPFAANQIGLGQGRRENVTGRGDQKPRLSFIPRVVQKNVAATVASTSTKTSNNGTNDSKTDAKSNDDFRKLLLKQ